MIEKMLAQQLLDRIDLEDRSISRIRRTGDTLSFTFSLFHCDDPERDDESLFYELIVSCNAEMVRFEEGYDLASTAPFDGEVLKVHSREDEFKFVCTCELKANRERFMLIFSLLNGVIEVEEKQPRPIADL